MKMHVMAAKAQIIEDALGKLILLAHRGRLVCRLRGVAAGFVRIDEWFNTHVAALLLSLVR